MNKQKEEKRKKFCYAIADAIVVNALRHALHVDEVRDSDLLDHQLTYAEEIEA